ncbi:MAG: CoA transferase, partial [Dehalococcoidia bacterium]
MPRQGRHHNSNFPFEVYPARDGLVGVHAGPGAWSDFAAMIGRQDLDTPDLATMPGRFARRAEIEAAILDWLAETDTMEAYHAGQARRFAFGYVATAADLLASPQLGARDFFREIDHPHAGLRPYPGAPFRMPSGWRDERAPLLGEHTEEVRAESVSGASPPRAVGAPGLDARQPLAGLRVLDLTQIWAGPRATKVLADFGADVIKVEAPGRLDGTRGYARYLADRAAARLDSEYEQNRRTQFEQLHRGQRSITLDLLSADGARAFRELVAQSDVVIANFAAGVVERLGIAWERLREVNPKVVLVSMTGFGDTGPERDYVGYGVTQEELCGIYGITGYQSGEPLKSGSNVGDPMNGMHAAVAVLAALVERERTGRGQYVELSQLESAINFVGEVLLDYASNGRIAGPDGNAHPAFAPHDIFPARGHDQWIAIAVETEAQWDALSEALGATDLAEDAAFRSTEQRRASSAVLGERIAALTREWERDALATVLQARGVPAAYCCVAAGASF